MRRIIVNNKSGREMSRATRVRARGTTTARAKKIAKLGRVGMFEFSFTLIKDKKHPGDTSRVIKETLIKTDSYDDAVLYAHHNTPAGHQGLIDGLTVVVK